MECPLSGIDSISLILNASACASSYSTIYPVLPSSITSGTPPTLVPTQGFSHAIASARTIPNASYSLGRTKTSQEAIAERYISSSFMWPVIRKLDLRSSLFISRSILSRIPASSPITTKIVCGCSLSMAGAEFTSCIRPLLGASLPAYITMFQPSFFF